MRKVYLQVVSRLVITVEDGVSISDAMDTIALDTCEPRMVQIEETTNDWEIYNEN